MIGRLLSGRYRLLEMVGSGGMAQVYRATDEKAGREVAVKVMHEQYAHDTEFIRRFEREAQSSAQVSHINLVQMLDVGVEGNAHYIVMEYIHGITLKDYIRDVGALPQKDAVAIAIHLCRALGHAHESGIIHRDIKPQNILIDDGGNVKLADFGIAKAVTSSTVTLTDGNVMGSVHYFSPEQARGHAADETSDLYSLGIVIFEMLTGSLPFNDDAPVAVALMHLQTPPPKPSTLMEGISPALDQIIAKLLQKEAKLRYQTAFDLEEDLHMALTQPWGGFVRMLAIDEAHTRATEVVKGRSARSGGQEKTLHRIRIALIAAVALLVLVAVFILGRPIWNTLNSTVTVPYFVGMQVDEAKDFARENSLSPDIAGVTSKDVPVGQVISQSIADGEQVESATRITLTISQGPELITIPFLENITPEQASEQLLALGLLLGDITKEASVRSVGTILRQLPKEGSSLRPGEKVHIWISGGSVNVPTLVDKMYDDGKKILDELGLLLSVTEEIRSDAPVGQILSQSPADDEQIIQGGIVSVTISSGHEVQYSVDVQVELFIEEDDTLVHIVQTNPDGTKSYPYTLRHDAGESKFSVTVKSSMTGLHTLEIIVDDESVETRSVTLTDQDKNEVSP